MIRRGSALTRHTASEHTEFSIQLWGGTFGSYMSIPEQSLDPINPSVTYIVFGTQGSSCH